MTDVSTLPPICEVQWAAGVWTAETGSLLAVQVRHGAADRANPDRPSLLPAVGSLTLSGRVADSRRGGRFRVRLRPRSGSGLLWSGWMAEPEADQGPPAVTRWRLAGGLSTSVEGRVDVDAGPRTAAAWIADAALWTRLVGGGVSAAGLPARTLRAVAVADRPVGGFVADLGAVLSAQPVERRDGTLRYVAHTPAASAVAGAAQLSNASARVLAARSRARADRVRNEVETVVASRAERAETVTVTVDHHQPNPRGVSWPRTTGRPGVNDDGSATLTWRVSVGRRWQPARPVTATVTDVTAWRVADGQRSVRDSPSNGPPLPFDTSRPRWLWSSAARPTTASATITADGTVTVTVTAWGASSVALPEGETGGLSLTVEVTATALPVVESAATERDAASIALWGPRPLRLPAWLAAARDLKSVIDGLAVLRHQHTVTVPVDQPAAAASVAVLDAGDYTAARIIDPGRGVHIAAVCYVAGRELDWRRGRAATITLRLVETGVAVTATAPGAPGAPAGTPTSSTIPAVWTAPTTGGAPASYDLRWRAGTSGAWTTVSGIAGLSHTITGLAASTSYRVEVRAVNSAGSSAWTRSTLTTAAGGTPPPPGQAPVLSAGARIGGDRFIPLTWTFTVPDGKTFRLWEIQQRLSGTSRWRAAGSNAVAATRSQTILTSRGRGTDIRIRCRYTSGDSPWSAIVASAGSASPDGSPVPVTLDGLPLLIDGRPITIADR